MTDAAPVVVVVVVAAPAPVVMAVAVTPPSVIASATTGRRGAGTPLQGYRALPAWHDHHMTDIKGCHAIVTGGSSGIGLAVAGLIATKGAKVSLIARDDEKLMTAAAQIRDATPMAAVATAAADVDRPRCVA